MLRRRESVDPLPPPPIGVTDAELEEARRAKLESTRDFMQAVDQNLEVRQRAERLRDRRTLNGFTELLAESMGIPKGKTR